MRHDDTNQLQVWAKAGARIELERIYATFPELQQIAPQATAAKPHGHAHRSVSPEPRAKLSRMMTRRWKAARKAGQSKLG
jgi:hypothetical protein